MRICEGKNCAARHQCLYHKEYNLPSVGPQYDFSLGEEACSYFVDKEKYEYQNLTILSNHDLSNHDQIQGDLIMRKTAQHMEIYLDDIYFVIEALLKAGYQVLLSQDTESPEIVMIDYLHPKHEGKSFEEVE